MSTESTAHEPDRTPDPADRLPRLEPRDLAADPLAMRALAHPTRIRLMEELTLRGPMTATEAAEHVGESPSSCSFHLRMLAKYGFVEEAEGGAGRRRPWRVVALGSRWRSGPDTEAAERAAGDLLGRAGTPAGPTSCSTSTSPTGTSCRTSGRRSCTTPASAAG